MLTKITIGRSHLTRLRGKDSVHCLIGQVAEQGTQMTPVGEAVTTHMDRLSMLAKVNNTGVQVDIFFTVFAQLYPYL